MQLDKNYFSSSFPFLIFDYSLSHLKQVYMIWTHYVKNTLWLKFNIFHFVPKMFIEEQVHQGTAVHIKANKCKNDFLPITCTQHQKMALLLHTPAVSNPNPSLSCSLLHALPNSYLLHFVSYSSSIQSCIPWGILTLGKGQLSSSQSWWFISDYQYHFGPWHVCNSKLY